MSGARIEREEALHLFRYMPLGELMRKAHAARMKRHPKGLVTFVCDTNPNYTNVCVTRCHFCAFHKDASDPGAYTLSPAELAARVKSAVELGATTVLLQGGHKPEVSLSLWMDYIRAIRASCPSVHIHPFSPPEIVFMGEREGIPVRDVLIALREEGIRTLPGGGAEVLSDRVRSMISPSKCRTDEWLNVMEQAHGLGFKTTATLMFGHVETDEEIVEHLLRLRDLQDRTGGFSSFIPWSFKPGKSRLSSQVSAGAHPAKYLRILASARLTLDNFPHLQSSWFSESIRAGQLGLLAGADDFGGILVEENVLRETGYVRHTAIDSLLRIIHDAGFVPARRDSDYNILMEYPVPRPNVPIL